VEGAITKSALSGCGVAEVGERAVQPTNLNDSLTRDRGSSSPGPLRAVVIVPTRRSRTVRRCADSEMDSEMARRRLAEVELEAVEQQLFGTCLNDLIGGSG
jgi:hypothetical protein